MADTHTTASIPAASRACQPCSRQGTKSTSRADSGTEIGRTRAGEDEGETQHPDDKVQDGRVKPQLKSRKSTTEWIDADKHNSSFFLRPSPSRSHLKHWNRTKSAVVSASASRRNTPVSMSIGLDAAPMPRVSKTEFENLPSSVQQKVSPYSVFLAYRKSSQPTPSLQDIPVGEAPLIICSISSALKERAIDVSKDWT